MGDRYQFIQGLRGLAVLAVMLFHLDLLELGFLGVDAFFVISGFVVYSSISIRVSQDRFSLGAFWKKRFFRLFPALLVTVVATVVTGLFLMNFIAREPTLRTGFFSLLGLSNIYTQLVSTDYFAPSAKWNGLLHTWSLSIEAQFYLLIPLLLVLTGMIASKRKSNLIFALVGLFSLASFLASQWLEDILLVGASTVGYYSPLPRIWQFLLGALVFTLVSDWQGNRRGHRGGYFTQILLVLAFPAILVFGSDFLNRETATILITSLTAGLLYYFGLNRNSLLLNNSLLVYIGDRSYSIYLIHWPVIVFVSLLGSSAFDLVLLSFLMTFPIAHLSHRVLEKPFMRKLEIEPFMRKSWRFMRYGIAVIAMLFVTLSSWLLPKFDTDEVFIEANRLSSLYSLSCHDGPKGCSFHGSGKDITREDSSTVLSGNRPIVLIGDSNAAQYFDGLLTATSELGLKFSAMTADGCPSFQVDGQVTSKACLNFRSNMSSFLRNAPPSVVFIGYSTLYLEAASSEEALQESNQRLNTHVLTLTEMGHQVVIIEPLPPVADFDLASMPGTNLTEVIEVPIEQNGTYRALPESFKELTGFWDLKDMSVSTFRPWSEICTESSCILFNGSSFNFRDKNHLSIDFSKNTAGQLEAFIVDQLQ